MGNKISTNFKKEIREAEKRIRPYIRETPVEYSPHLSQGDSHVYLKLENMQVTGSFKIRGVLNMLLSLSDTERKRIVTASSGNHGVAIAYALRKFGWKGTIFLPENASKAKVQALQSGNADIKVKFYGTDCVQAEIFARETARKNNWIYVSPYNDVKIISGQGTIGIELQKQIKKIDAVFVPVGGGGLISGIVTYLKSVDNAIEIIGCQPEASPVMYKSIKAGRIIEMESLPTISDGTSGGIEQGAVTFEICRDLVDDFVLVSEDEIKEAIKFFLEKSYMLIEGAAALSVASYRKVRERFKGKNIVLIVSGSKLSLDQLKEVLCKEDDNDENF